MWIGALGGVAISILIGVVFIVMFYVLGDKVFTGSSQVRRAARRARPPPAGPHAAGAGRTRHRRRRRRRCRPGVCALAGRPAPGAVCLSGGPRAASQRP